MKTLYLVRHAKSSRDDPTLADRDRPLNDRGLDDAPEMGKRLAKRRVDPDLIVSSPAARALKTAQLIAAEIGYECANIVIEERLYAAPVDDLLSVIRATDKKVDRLMLCGHNPEFSDLATRLAGEPIDMPTCAVAEFAYDDARWSDVGTVKPSRTGLEKPKK
ncbi:MAG TPA: histidine phosphatase family protein [Burkholderiaceae bacterium]|nr:histidine phosphatase family protein [Burkholderiaceae bacterium]